MATIAELRQKVEQVKEKLNSGELSGKNKKERNVKEEDPRMWYPALDEKKNGYGIFRFLPPAPGASVPWATMMYHNFKVGTKWFFGNCPTTINEKCPICEANSEEWKKGPQGQALARERKRKVKYWYNIFVLSDPVNKENNGKNKIFRSGSKIWDMTQDALTPQFPGESPIDAFDPFAGAPFEMKIREADGNVNYDKSDFMKSKAGPIGDDAFIEKIWNQEFDLSEFCNPSLFDDYVTIKKKFEDLVGGAPALPVPESQKPRSSEPEKRFQTEDKPVKEPKVAEPNSEDNTSYFQSFADED